MTAEAHRTAPATHTIPAAAGPGGLRAMTRQDMPAIARLFTRVFRRADRPVEPELPGYLETVFFGSPHYRPEVGSIVHEARGGEVTSAILAVPMEFMVDGRPVVARLLCAFMAEGKDSAVGAARLSRQMRAAQQDLVFSDNASPVSADHWMAGGGMVLPIQSLEWRRSFRPAAAGALTGSRRLRILGARPVLAALGLVDRALRRSWRSVVPAPVSGGRVVATDADGFFACIAPMTARFRVRPVWSRPEFDWLLSVAALNRRLGALHFRLVLDRAEKPIGAFLIFGTEGREARVLNVLCEEGREVEVIGHMFAALDAEGYALASGPAQPFMMNGILRQRWLTFRSGGHFCMATRHPEIVDAARSNDIFIGGLASESWSRLLTDF